jgi:mono/diheme cytochrome c family protein
VKSHRRALLLLGFGVTWFACAGAAWAQTNANTPSESEHEHLIYSVKGQDLFRAHCAACHGPQGKGDGPLAPALKAKVPDLTLLAKNSGGKFPSVRVRDSIAGDKFVQSHGSREMPIWGPIFHQIESDQDFGDVRLQNLTKYLESIQQK